MPERPQPDLATWKPCSKCKGKNLRPPWQGWCYDCMASAHRKRYRKIREEQGYKVYGKDEKLADAELTRKFIQQEYAERPKLGPPE